MYRRRRRVSGTARIVVSAWSLVVKIEFRTRIPYPTRLRKAEISLIISMIDILNPSYRSACLPRCRCLSYSDPSQRESDDRLEAAIDPKASRSWPTEKILQRDWSYHADSKRDTLDIFDANTVQGGITLN